MSSPYAWTTFERSPSAVAICTMTLAKAPTGDVSLVQQLPSAKIPSPSWTSRRSSASRRCLPMPSGALTSTVRSSRPRRRFALELALDGSAASPGRSTSAALSSSNSL